MSGYIKNDENIPWSTIYNQNREIINSKNDILGQEIEEEVEISDDESLKELSEDDDTEEFRFDWMYLAEMGPNVQDISKSDLGTRDIDRSHDWTSECQSH